MPDHFFLTCTTREEHFGDLLGMEAEILLLIRGESNLMLAYYTCFNEK